MEIFETSGPEMVADFYDNNGFWAKALVWIVFVVGVIKFLYDINRCMSFCCKHSCRPKNKKLFQKYGDQVTKNTWAVVTGGSDGIGFEYCLEFARQDFNICIIARNKQKCEDKLAEIRQRTGKSFESKVIVADFSTLYYIEDYQYMQDELNGLDIGMLVLNAGWAESFWSHMMPEEWVEKQMTINVYQISFLTRKVLPLMKSRQNQKKGGIIMISSLAAFVDLLTGKDYCASKAYALKFATCLHHELKPDGIDVQAYCPSKIDTNLLRENNPGEKNDVIQPDVAVASSLRDLGYESWTHGAFTHDFHAWMATFVSQNFINNKVNRVAGDYFTNHPKFEHIRQKFPDAPEIKNMTKN